MAKSALEPRFGTQSGVFEREKKRERERRGVVGSAGPRQGPRPAAEKIQNQNNSTQKKNHSLAHAGMYLATISPKHMGGWYPPGAPAHHTHFSPPAFDALRQSFSVLAPWHA